MAFDAMFEDLGLPLLMDRLADPVVTHYPAGVIANAATVDGILEIGETEKRDDKGRGDVTRAELQIGDDVTVDDADRWLIDGITWNTDRNGKPQAGVRIVHLVKWDNESRTAAARDRSGR